MKLFNRSGNKRLLLRAHLLLIVIAIIILVLGFGAVGLFAKHKTNSQATDKINSCLNADRQPIYDKNSNFIACRP